MTLLSLAIMQWRLLEATVRSGGPKMRRFPPESVIQSWPKPNYVDPVTRGPALLIVNIILLTFSTIAVAGRLYSRIFIKRWFGVDDVMIVPAYVFAHGLTAVVILANLNDGWNRHEWDIPPSMFPSASKISFAAKILFTLAATFIRLSLICFYYRLVRDSGLKRYRWVLHGFVICAIIIGFVFLMLAIFECSPIRAFWVYPPIGYCMNEGKVLFGTGIINSVLDLLTTILPIPIIMHLRMPMRQRIGVLMLLCLGIFATMAGCLRVYYTWKSLMASYDTSWWAYPLWLSAAIEIHLGMICACAPAWKSLLQNPVKKISSLIGVKASSLRQSSTPKPLLSAKPKSCKALRNLSRFQITRLDFQRTQRDDGDEYGLVQTEKGFGEPLWPPPKVRVKRSQPSEIFLDPEQPAPGLFITKTQSFDQSSIHLQGPHVREPPIAPSHWIWEGSPRKSSYVRTVDN